MAKGRPETAKCVNRKPYNLAAGMARHREASRQLSQDSADFCVEAKRRKRVANGLLFAPATRGGALFPGVMPLMVAMLAAAILK